MKDFYQRNFIDSELLLLLASSIFYIFFVMLYPWEYCYKHIINGFYMIITYFFGLVAIIISFLVFIFDFEEEAKYGFKEFTIIRLVSFSLGVLVLGISLYLTIKSKCHEIVDTFIMYGISYLVVLFSMIIPLIILSIRRRSEDNITNN